MFKREFKKSAPTFTQPTKVVPETNKKASGKCPNHKDHMRNCVDCERQ